MWATNKFRSEARASASSGFAHWFSIAGFALLDLNARGIRKSQMIAPNSVLCISFFLVFLYFFLYFNVRVIFV